MNDVNPDRSRTARGRRLRAIGCAAAAVGVLAGFAVGPASAAPTQKPEQPAAVSAAATQTVPVSGKTYSTYLNPGDRLEPGDQVVSQDGRTQLILQTDGRFVLYRDGSQLWELGTNNHGKPTEYFSAEMQDNGNFVVSYRATNKNDVRGVPFQTDLLNPAEPGSRLRVDPTGFAIVKKTGTYTTSTSYRLDTSFTNTLSTGQVLGMGSTLRSADGRASLTMQTDGNLVATRDGVVVWDAVSAKFGGKLKGKDEYWKVRGGDDFQRERLVRYVGIGGDGSMYAIWQQDFSGDKNNSAVHYAMTTPLLSGGPGSSIAYDSSTGLFGYYRANGTKVATFGNA